MRTSSKKCLGRLLQWKDTALFGASAQLLFRARSALGVCDASVSAYVLTVPQTSTSHALGMRSLLIMLMIVHGTTPKNSSIAVQHCTALIVTSTSCIQPSITAPSLAILRSAGCGMPSVGT